MTAYESQKSKVKKGNPVWIGILAVLHMQVKCGIAQLKRLDFVQWGKAIAPKVSTSF
jgi:hypothetical protein